MASDGFLGFSLSKKLIFHVVDATSLALVLICQGSILNFYIISHYRTSVNPYFWFIADFACLFVFAGTLTISYQYLSDYGDDGTGSTFYLSPKRIMCTRYPTSKLGILPLSYVSWIFYSMILIGKVLMIFKSEIPDHLNRDDVLGPQLLQVTIALSGVIFLLLAEGHNSAKRNTLRYEYVTSTCAKTGIEILDSVNLLSLLLVNETKMILTFGFEDAVLILCVTTFLLPGVALYKLSLSNSASEKLALIIKVMYNLLHLCLIDVPFFMLRMYLWSYYSYDASVFLMKNTFGILFAVRRIYPDTREWFRLKRQNAETQRTNSNGYLPSPTDDHIELENLGDKGDGGGQSSKPPPPKDKHDHPAGDV